MDLIDRYLDTVRLLLPGGQRNDIIAELRDLLMSRREEQEAAMNLDHLRAPNILRSRRRRTACRRSAR